MLPVLTRADLTSPHDHLETLRLCGGYYLSPEGSDALLVGYAGTYEDNDGVKRQLVGKTYYNWAKCEENPDILEHLGSLLADRVRMSDVGGNVDVVLGAPMGGIATAYCLALYLGVRFGFVEKEVTKVKTSDSREETKLVISRHDVFSGDHVLVVEDVCNNFSTTDKMIQLIADRGATMVGVACLTNRSMGVKLPPVPIIGLMEIPTAQWRQDDPEVADLIAAGRIVPKPKNDWARLMEVNAAGRTT
ncbi:MAG: phosphoribosyltransferase family protein [bacterium]|nr:phosphoribosyltransferase family protein [bacterium]